MIGFVRGIVHAYGLDYVLIDVNGIGYRINFNHPESLTVGQEMTIYTYQNVREDEISLFGFLSLQEYDLFVKLISVKGLGPRTASSILGRASTDDVIKAIEDGDVDFMKRMPGVGNKTASQIILDLKGKLDITENTITLTFKFKDDVASMWGIVSETENENMKETMETLAKTAKDSFEIEDPVQTVAVYKNNDDTVLDTFSYSSN